MAEEHLNFDVRRRKEGGGNTEAEILQDIFGRFNRFQLMVFLLVASPKLATACNMMGVIFWAPKGKQDYTCGGKPNICPCDSPVFDNSIYGTTIISEWDLICDRDVYITYAQSIFQFGVLLGSYLFGWISDRWGRRTSLYIAAVTQLVSSITASLASSIYIFMAHRLVIGISTGGAIVIAFVLLNEYLHPRDRDIVGPCFFLTFNFCCVFVPILGYFCRNWRHFQFASGLASFAMLPMFCFLPESPRWLIAQGKIERAIKILENVRRCNKKPIEMVRPAVEKMSRLSEKAKEAKCSNLLTNPILRRFFLIMCFLWFTVSFYFYGVVQFVGHIHGDLYQNTAFNHAANFVGCSFGVPITYYSKRKPQVFFMILIAGICILVIKVTDIIVIQVVAATIGSMFSFIVFNLAFIYGSELYPTVIRSTAMGLNSSCARIGSVVTPFVVDLKEQAWAPVLFAIPTFITALLSLFLDETKGIELPTSIEDIEKRHKNIKNKKKSEKEKRSEKP